MRTEQICFAERRQDSEKRFGAADFLAKELESAFNQTKVHLTALQT